MDPPAQPQSLRHGPVLLSLWPDQEAVNRRQVGEDDDDRNGASRVLVSVGKS